VSGRREAGRGYLDSTCQLEERGYQLPHPAKTEPRGQTITRVLTDHGLVIDVSHDAWLYDTPLT
jgi:hypothetical protein